MKKANPAVAETLLKLFCAILLFAFVGERQYLVVRAGPPERPARQSDGNPTPAPRPTITSGSIPPGTTEGLSPDLVGPLSMPNNLLQDRSFESYTPNPSWSETSTNYATPLCTVTDCSSDPYAGPRSGSVWAWFGGTSSDETGSLSQTVSIPSGAATLQFYLWIGYAEAGSDGNDKFTAQIDGVPVFSANATQSGAYASYVKVEVDISTYADGASHLVQFSSSTTGQQVNFNLDDAALCSGTCVGIQQTRTFCNPTPISIYDGNDFSPYPSVITASGLGNSITKVTVQLKGLTHDWPSNIDILLVGPQDQNLVVMSDVGSAWSVFNVDLTLDDSAPQYLPDFDELTSGTYRPSSYYASYMFPPPAPDPSDASALSVFNGTNPNGVWSLYITDIWAEFDEGSFDGGWCLVITTSADSGIDNTIPTPQLPVGTISDPTPMYTWERISAASQYQFELWKNSTVVYTKIADSSACGTTTCSNTPADLLSDGTYTWRVRAMIGGIWQTYSVYKTFELLTVPTPQTPSGGGPDTTPTYQWTRIGDATQYQYELWKGSKRVYTKTVPASACNASTCSNTPKTLLVYATYKWKVRAMVEGAWRPFSVSKTFNVNNKPKAGFWSGPGVEFYVIATQNKVKSFAIGIYVNGCGSYKITRTLLAPIVNRNFVFTGSFYASGVFDSVTKAHGSTGLRSFFIPGCGTVSGGPFPWKASWRNASQSADALLEEPQIMLGPAEDPGSYQVEIDPVQP